MTDEEWDALAPQAEAYAKAKARHALFEKWFLESCDTADAFSLTRSMLDLREAAHALDMAHHHIVATRQVTA